MIVHDGIKSDVCVAARNEVIGSMTARVRSQWHFRVFTSARWSYPLSAVLRWSLYFDPYLFFEWSLSSSRPCYDSCSDVFRSQHKI